jgi:hypothetical protein
MGFFQIRSHELFAQGWLGTTILLISASWVATIIDVSLPTPNVVHEFLKIHPASVLQRKNKRDLGPHFGEWETKDGPEALRGWGRNGTQMTFQGLRHRLSC